jgi:hypothetical protein
MVFGEALVVVVEALPPYGLVDPLLHPMNANNNEMVNMNIVRMNLSIINESPLLLGLVELSRKYTVQEVCHCSANRDCAIVGIYSLVWQETTRRANMCGTHITLVTVMDSVAVSSKGQVYNAITLAKWPCPHR